MRKGLIKAVELVVEHNVPLEVYWICAGPEGHFEVANCVSPKQVTMLILTPSIPEEAHELSRRLNLSDEEPIIMIQHGPLPEDAYGVEVLEEDGDLERLWEEEWRRAVTRAALDELRNETGSDPRTIQIFEQLTREGRSPRDVAAEFRMTTNAVYVAKHRAIQRLRTILTRLQEEF